MKTFEELGVSAEIRRAIEEMGYENPMPVQEEVIPYLLGEGNDVVALAQTGTGKTAAFGLPLIQKTDVLCLFQTGFRAWMSKAGNWQSMEMRRFPLPVIMTR